MEFGASIFFTDYSITPAELAVAMEERGFDSVWAAEHSHIPVPRRTSPFIYKHGQGERRSRSASFYTLKFGVLGTARTFDRTRLREIRTLSMSRFDNTP